MTLELLLHCLVAYFFWLGVWVVIFRSPLVPDFLEAWVTDNPMTHQDVETFLINTGRFKLLRLWACQYCQAFWTSCAFAVTLSVLVCCSISWWWCFLAPVWALTFYPWYLSSVSKLWRL
jgi:hypothetical protein